MILRIKNWSKHQHFKDRTPPWIKLYREILDDPDWHDLDGDVAKVLIGLWLIASEDDTHSGALPEPRKLAFRLRMKEGQLKQALNKLSDWLVQDDIGVISQRYQSDAPERAGEETETETETETCSDVFSVFWEAYPKKVGKGAAEKAWARAKVNGHFAHVMKALTEQKCSAQWEKDGGQFIPNPATWINQRRWEDQLSPPDTERTPWEGAL